MMRETFQDCEEGDCVDWNYRPSDANALMGSQRSIHDIQEVDGKLVVLPAVQWRFEPTNEGGVKVWKCVKKGRHQ